ncbi:MAG TPA: quinone-dependent dihydroorotate dehydrogenase [Myxococcales bacterium]|nr:quinone-dependent dihydroorotate dehydrogenase [Myxococcales bacterium]
MSGFYRVLKPLLFLLDAERAHGIAGSFLLLWARLFPAPRRIGLPRTLRAEGPLPSACAGVARGASGERRDGLAQTLWGLRFPSPVGLAAGMDKGQVLAPAFFRLGFGFVEIGSITPRPQAGNPRPRLFRLPGQRAIINRMGFNNPGAEIVARRLARLPRQPGPVGINLGRNKVTPNERAADEYAAAFRALAPFADYAAINVSSPNTPGLRALQAEGELARLVGAVAQERDALARASSGRRVPLLVKLSPDEPPEQICGIAEAALAAGADGLIATNTTLSRGGVEGHRHAGEAGGLSGAPLAAAAMRVCARLYLRVGQRAPLIGVGGILSAEDAYRRIRAGASLVQLYTALVYGGPAVARDLAAGLQRLLSRDGLTLSEAVGKDAAQLAELSG